MVSCLALDGTKYHGKMRHPTCFYSEYFVKSNNIKKHVNDKNTRTCLKDLLLLTPQDEGGNKQCITQYYGFMQVSLS